MRHGKAYLRVGWSWRLRTGVYPAPRERGVQLRDRDSGVVMVVIGSGEEDGVSLRRAMPVGF